MQMISSKYRDIKQFKVDAYLADSVKVHNLVVRFQDVASSIT